VTCDDSDVTSDDDDDDVVNRKVDSVAMKATSWTLEGPQLQLTFVGCDFNYIFAMRLWSLAAALHGPFFVGGAGGAGGFLGSLLPVAALLNPHLTTGYAVEVSKFFNIQPYGMGKMLAAMVRSGLTMEEARAVLGCCCTDRASDAVGCGLLAGGRRPRTQPAVAAGAVAVAACRGQQEQEQAGPILLKQCVVAADCGMRAW
jgi:hypothetical protein